MRNDGRCHHFQRVGILPQGLLDGEVDEPPGHPRPHQQRRDVRLAPSIVDDAVWMGVVVVGKQPEQAVAIRGPADVVPQHVRLVLRDELSHLGISIGRIVAARSGPDVVAERPRDPWLERPVHAAGVIDAEPEPMPPDRRGELADDIASTRPVGLVRVGHPGRPETEAVVILRHEHDVSRTGGGEDPGPAIGIPVREVLLEGPREALIRHVAVVASMKRRRWRRWILDGVPVVLGVRMDEHRSRVVGAQHRREVAVWCEAGDRKQSPVDEHAELGVGEPSGHAMTVER